MKWKNKWQTEGSAEKNLLLCSTQMFVQPRGVLQNKPNFQHFLLSQKWETNLQPKGAADLQLPDMCCLKSKEKKIKAKQTLNSFLFDCFAVVVFDWAWSGWVYTVKGCLCGVLGVLSIERVKPPRMQELCCVWWRQTFIRPFTTSSWNPSTSCKSKNHKYSSPYISTRSWEHGMLQNALNPVIVSCNNTFFTFGLGSYQGERT